MQSVRQQITLAYSVFKRGRSAFQSHPVGKPSQDPKNAATAKNKPLKGGKTPSHKVTATETRISSGKSGDILERALIAGAVIAAVERLPPVKTAWLQFAYVDDLPNAEQLFNFLGVHLFTELGRATPPFLENKTPKTVARMRVLGYVALLDARHRYQHAKPLYSYADIAREHLKMSNAKNFGKQFGKAYSFYLSEIERLDREALRAVAAQI